MTVNDIIGEYSKNPQNKFKLDNFTISHFEESRLCGDTIEIFLLIKDNIIADFSFTWETSMITTACASIFWESIIWLKTHEILKLDFNYIKELVWDISPRRRYGASLWLLATRNTIHKYLKDGIIDDFSDVID